MAEFTDGIAVGMAIVRPTGGVIVSKTLTQNGTYYAIADAADGYDPVTVAVPIASKSITKNGIYYAADDDLKGFDPVNVSVPMYWTFQPGETVPPSMIDPEKPMEEDAPASSEDVPHPTQEDPQRVIRPKFVFKNLGRIQRESDGAWVAHYEGELYDAITNELLEPPQIMEHYWNDDETFELKSWTFSGGTLTVGYRYNWYGEGVIYYDTRYYSTNVGNYTASWDSGQNTTTVYGG